MNLTGFSPKKLLHVLYMRYRVQPVYVRKAKNTKSWTMYTLNSDIPDNDGVNAKTRTALLMTEPVTAPVGPNSKSIRLLMITLTLTFIVDTSTMTARVARSAQCQFHRSATISWLRLLLTGRSIMN